MIENSYSYVIFTFHLRRRPMYFIVNLIIPYCMLSFIAVVAFLLQPSCTRRLGLNITILLALSVYQVVVNDRLPTSSDTVPVIVIYFLFVIGLCVLSVTTTIYVLYLHMCADTVPLPTMGPWMKWFVCTKLGSLLCLGRSQKTTPAELINGENSAIAAGDAQKENQLVKLANDVEGSSDKMDKLLMVMVDMGAMMAEMRDLMRSKHHREVEDRNVAEEDEEKKSDWMLAAAVMDRIFATLISILFIAATATLIIFCVYHIHFT